MGLIESFNRTLRRILEKYFTAYRHHRWIDILDDVIANYNNTKHSSIKCTPNDYVPGSNSMTKSQNEDVIENSGIEAGDRVRVIKPHTTFQKGATEKWSENVYTVAERIGNSWRIEGLKRLYKHYELQEVKGEPEGLKKGLRVQSTDKRILNEDKIIKRIMKELDINEAEAKRMLKERK